MVPSCPVATGVGTRKFVLKKKSWANCWRQSRATEGKRGRYRPVATGERGAGRREARCRSRIPLESTSVLLLPASLSPSLCVSVWPPCRCAAVCVWRLCLRRRSRRHRLQLCRCFKPSRLSSLLTFCSRIGDQFSRLKSLSTSLGTEGGRLSDRGRSASELEARSS